MGERGRESEGESEAGGGTHRGSPKENPTMVSLRCERLCEGLCCIFRVLQPNCVQEAHGFETPHSKYSAPFPKEQFPSVRGFPPPELMKAIFCLSLQL